jgi:hypothetical protein
MARQLYSPYGPRGRQSGTLVVAWIAAFFTILVILYYINSRHPDAASYVKESYLGAGKARRGLDS